MLSSQLVISFVVVVVVCVVIIGGVVLIRPGDHTVAPTAQSVAPPATTDFPAGKLIHSTPKGY